ncbi:hypothetical protein [Actinoplanes sp. G11-F43]|uniref:hypothetical protein n=1 Tax=Actinoplanes sp. G11-F43 TaxID=3424130 RepID=UPI003D354979
MSYRIEDVLESVGEGGPAPRTSTADIIAGAHRIRSRRRWATAAGAGSAVAVTVAVIAGLGGTTPRAATPELPPAATPTASFTAPSAARNFQQPNGLAFTVAAARAGTLRVGPGATATFGYQRFPVYRDGVTLEVDGVAYPYPEATLTFYQPGVFDRQAFGKPEGARGQYGPEKRLTIMGRAGFERAVTYRLPDLADMRAKLRANPKLNINDPSIRTESFSRTAFAWQFDGRSWATFVPNTGREPLSRADSLAIVEALMPGAQTPAVAPYTMGWLPAGWSATAVDREPTDVVSRVFFDDRPPAGRELATSLDDYPAGGVLTIWAGDPKDTDAPAAGEPMKCVDVNGYCTMLLGDGYFAEFERHGRGLSMDQVRRILRSLKVTTISDRSTWKPVQSRF